MATKSSVQSSGTKKTRKPRAASTANSDKKELAELLYTRNNLTRKETAQRVGVTEKTLGNWVKEYGWEAKRKSLLVTKDEQMRCILDQISALSQAIKDNKEKGGYADTKQADTYVKLTAAYRNFSIETGLAETLEVFTKVLTFAQANFPEHHTNLIKILDSYIQPLLR